MKYLTGGLGIAALLASAVATFAWHKWDVTDKALNLLASQAQTVVVALTEATGNRRTTWDTAPGQIRALGEDYRQAKDDLEIQNQSLREQAEEARRLKDKAAELQKIAEKAEAQRRAAYIRLSNMAITPGVRDDCMNLLKDAEEALDIAYEEGV